MPAKILLHLGMPKTGTSALQHALATLSAKEPAEVVYPRRFRERSVGHHGLPAALAAAGPEGIAAIAGTLLHDAEPAMAPIVYSSEGLTSFCGVRGVPKLEALAAALMPSVSLSAILVVREMTSFYEAMFLQSGRFGTIRMSFAEYVASRVGWTYDLFRGAARLTSQHGTWFEAVMQRPGTDTLALCDGWLGLPPGTLRDASRSSPSTSRRSLKEEVAMFFAPEISDRVGMELPRSELMALFQTGRDIFVDDCARFTLYEREERHDIMGRVLSQANKAGLSGYVEAFAASEPPVAERRCLSAEVLTDADLDRLREALTHWRAQRRKH